MFNTLPARFRHYEVLKLLGGGGFGVVYLARDTDLKRLVVLKMLHPHLAAQPDMVRRFVLEARAMARLDHANIVRINRVKSDPQRPFFEMEYVEGQTLANYRASKVLSLQQAMPILKQMAAALDAAHRQKIVHRDVKPDNVLIKADGQLKLTDFGIIKLLDATGTLHPSTGGIIGTPSYMAPEQVDINRKHEIGPATDIYALGVVAYELLTGKLPFFGGHAQAILYAHAHTPPPDPRDFNPYLAVPVAQVLLNVLAKQPSNRYPTAMLFVQALEQAASGGAPPPRLMTSSHISPPTPSVTPPLSLQTPSATPTAQTAISKQMIIGLIVLLLVAMIVGGLLNRVFSSSPSPESAPDIAQATLTLPAEEPESTPATPSLSIGSTMLGQDRMTLLYVPAGEFLRGSKEDDPDADDDEHPQRSIYLDAFWIDQTEVTNEMFARFVEQTQYQTDAEKEGWGYAFTGTSWQRTDGAEWRHPHGPDSSIDGLEQHPVVQVSWNDAKAYCEWAGRRLPTEAEWEKAARGTDGWKYPWGNEDVADNLVNLCDKNCPYSNNRIDSIDDGYEFTAPVGSYPDGTSPYGALDMAGNVWEWTADFYDAAYYHDAPERNPQGPATGELRLLRGASWNNEARRVRAGDRGGDAPAVRLDNIGARCAASP